MPGQHEKFLLLSSDRDSDRFFANLLVKMALKKICFFLKCYIIFIFLSLQANGGKSLCWPSIF